MLRILGICALLALAACRPGAAGPPVVVTIKPVHGLVAGVMEGVGEPALLMGGTASPHSYQMRPSDARQLEGAGLVIWVGPAVESTFPAMLNMLGGETRVFEALEAPGLELLAARASGAHRGPEQAPGEDHAHDGVDPHFWLDPANAIVLTESLVAELSDLDPANAAAYRANGDAQIERLEALDRELRDALAPVAGTAFITFHDAFQYFETAYGLHGIASVAIGPEREPGLRTVAGLRELIRTQEVACVFAEPQFPPRLAETLVEGTAARIGQLDPIGRDIAAGPRAYDALMRALAADAAECLSKQSGSGRSAVPPPAPD